MIKIAAICAALLLLAGCRAEAPIEGSEEPVVAAPATETEAAPPAADREAASEPQPTLREEVRWFSQPAPLLPMQILEMTALPGVRTYTLTPAYYTVLPEGGEPVKVPVAFERVAYRVRAVVEHGDKRVEWSDEAWCFDLHSTDPSHPYSHTFWLHRVEPFPADAIEWPPASMQFFALGNGEKYLAGLRSGAGPWILDVSQPLSKEASLREYISREIQRPRENWDVTPLYNMGAIVYHGSAAKRPVPTWCLFPGDAFSTASGPIHIAIREVSRDERGNLVVSVTGLDPNRVFRAVFDGKQWRAG